MRLDTARLLGLTEGADNKRNAFRHYDSTHTVFHSPTGIPQGLARDTLERSARGPPLAHSTGGARSTLGGSLLGIVASGLPRAGSSRWVFLWERKNPDGRIGHVRNHRFQPAVKHITLLSVCANDLHSSSSFVVFLFLFFGGIGCFRMWALREHRVSQAAALFSDGVQMHHRRNKTRVQATPEPRGRPSGLRDLHALRRRVAGRITPEWLPDA